MSHAKEKSNWADSLEEESETPTTEEIVEGNIKTVIEYRTNRDGKKVKIVRQYKIETRQVSKTVALRKTWPKFGLSRTDGPGPQAYTTVIAEEVNMQFFTGKDDVDKPQEDSPLELLKKKQTSTVRCRECKGDHFTHSCPYKNVLPTEVADDKKPKTYVPPNRRDGGDGAASKYKTMMPKKDNSSAIRINNLSEEAKESDVKELCEKFGKVDHVYIKKNKLTGESKGFAFVTFQSRRDAQKAIMGLHGHGYDHLILRVEWLTMDKNQF